MSDLWRKRVELCGGRAVCYLGDCLDILPTLEAGSVDAVVADPPYGICYNRPGTRGQDKHKHCNRRQTAVVIGDDRPFDPAPLIKYPFVLWGANNYASRLPDLLCWLCWDKVLQNGLRLRIAECEFAASNCVKRPRVFRHLWSGNYRDSEQGTSYHPTQKPLALMAWCLGLPGVPSGTVADPFMGSGTTGVAAIQSGRRFVGIEIDEGYFETACQRIADAAPLFTQAGVDA